MSWGPYESYFGGARTSRRYYGTAGARTSHSYGRGSYGAGARTSYYDTDRGARDVRFINDWDTPVRTTWNGTPHGVLNAGEVVRVDTYPGHNWKVYDEVSGEKLSEFTIRDGRSRYKFSRYADEEAPRTRHKRNHLVRRSTRARQKEEYDDYGGTTPRDLSYESEPWINRRRGPCIHHIYEAGHVGNTQRTPSGHILVTKSTHPRVFTIKSFLTRSECDHIINLASRQGFDRSTVSGGYGGGEYSHSRTSSTSWLKANASGTMGDIFERSAKLLQISSSELRRCAEDLQVVHYGKGQKNSRHHDYLGLGQRGNDRILTLLFYLKDADEYEGGYTEFFHPGIKVKGNKGDAVLFYNMHPDGNHDEKSLHAGTPIFRGEKYIANFWVWDTAKE